MTEPFEALLARRLSRRGLLGAAVGGTLLFGAGEAAVEPAAGGAGSRTAGAPRNPPLPSLAPSRADALLLAPGYRYSVVARWGDALWNDTAALSDLEIQRGALVEAPLAARQERQFGTNCDGLGFFPNGGARGVGRDAGRRGVLCVNHEYVQPELAFAGQPLSGIARAEIREAWTKSNPDAVRWMQAAHGVSVIQVERDRRGWQLRRSGRGTRRITANTLCELAGPARGAELLRTGADPSGTRARGTFANCAAGKSLWGTYLTSEENIDDYFGGYRSWASATDDFATLDAHARFPLFEQSPYGWEHVDPRFDLRREPREALHFGWIVEIDPMDPTAAPKKRTALGRFSHEGANTILARDGRVATYMGDDDKFEYVYKFVTRDRFDPKRPAANRDLLDHGTLYAARFAADGSGAWLPLVHDEAGPLNSRTGFRSQADVVIKARAAADLLGATPMDRPEDVEPNPVTGRVYMALTKNGDRERAPRRDFVTNREIDLGADAANPRARNDFGHIIELIEGNDDAAATRFMWNVFLLAGDPRDRSTRFLVDAAAIRPGDLQRGDTYYAGFADREQVSPIACPDNLGFDPQGRLWIVTDSDGRSLANNGCFVVPTQGPLRGQLRQLASGPVGSEICGCEFTPDGRTLFLSIQHPGEGGTIDKPVSHWPDGGVAPPRSSLVAVSREDGDPL